MRLSDRLRANCDIASAWHGGQWSALYSFASTGKVWDEDHRARLITEIDECAPLAETPTDAEELRNLRAYIVSVVF